MPHTEQALLEAAAFLDQRLIFVFLLFLGVFVFLGFLLFLLPGGICSYGVVGIFDGGEHASWTGRGLYRSCEEY